MKSGMPTFKNQQKQSKSTFKLQASLEKQFHLKNQNTKRLRIVQSVTLGHVRGGHSFH